MAANVTLLPALYDIMFAAGIGAALATLYRIIRLICGGKKQICIFCDIFLFAITAVVYKSAVHSFFYYPSIRIYTIVSMTIAYIAALNTFLLPVYKLEKVLHNEKNSKKHKKSNKKLNTTIAK